MTAYWVGDEPALPVLLSPVRDGRHVDLDGFTGATGRLLTPSGSAWPAVAQLVDDEDEGRVVSFLVPPELDVAGLYWAEIVLTGGGSESFQLPVVVQEPNGWHTLASARAEWEDAGEISDDRLWTLLETARIECVAYAPKLPAQQLPPVNYREAQLLHARNRADASRVNPANGDAGGDGFSLTVFPIDWTVRQLLRPMRGVKRVG